MVLVNSVRYHERLAVVVAEVGGAHPHVPRVFHRLARERIYHAPVRNERDGAGGARGGASSEGGGGATPGDVRR